VKNHRNLEPTPQHEYPRRISSIDRVVSIEHHIHFLLQSSLGLNTCLRVV
jgi:hypothetical protein